MPDCSPAGQQWYSRIFRTAHWSHPLSKKNLFWTAFGVLAFAMAVVQFVPAPALLVPATLPAEQREAHRLLNFEGIANFRDLGGYATADGKQVR